MPTEPDPEGFVAIEGVRYRYGAGGPAIVDGVDWTVPRGAIHCLLGRSGCGKTTLLKLAAGLLAPDEGRVRVAGAVLRGPAPRVGFVFQAPTLLDWLSALDNVLLPLSLKRRPAPPTARPPGTSSPWSGSPTMPAGTRPRCRAASRAASRWRGR